MSDSKITNAKSDSVLYPEIENLKSFKSDSVLYPEIENLKSKTKNHDEKFIDFKKELYNERLNNITVFGIFASLVTFFSVEIQVFKNIESFWLLIGLTSFLVSTMLLFVFSLNSIIKDKLNWKEDFSKNPIFGIFIFFLLFSFVIFLFNFKNKKPKETNENQIRFNYNESKTIDKYYNY